MTSRLEIFVKQLVLAVDILVLIFAFLLSYLLRQNSYFIFPFLPWENGEFLSSLASFERYLWLLLVILPVWVSMLHMMGGYRELRLKSKRQITQIVFKASLLSLFIFGSIIFLLKYQYVSRTFMALFFLLAFFMLSVERGILIWFWRRLALKDYFRRNLLVVGTGPRARKVIGSLKNESEWGVSLIGIIDSDKSLVGQFVDGIPVIGTLAEIADILQTKLVNEVVFVVPRGWITRIEDAVLECERMGVKATIAADLFNIHVAKAHPSEIAGMPTITFDTTPFDQWQLALKRVIDIVFSSLGIVVLSPLMLAAAALIKITSPGSVLFKQIRCGLNGRLFTIYKFRSMVTDAEARQRELFHLNEMEGPVFKLSNDPRLTFLGRWLRKTSIDELPQLFNVFKGDISLVGPRPPIPSEVAQYERWQLRRLSMRPGITGYWQVNGRNQLKNFQDWVRLDLKYIDEWSLWLDFKILLKTVPAAIFGWGAR